VAIRHIPEETLSQHYYGRTGDFWKASLPYMKRRTAGGAVLRVLGLTLTYQDGAQRLPLPCTHCDAEELTESQAYPCRYVPGMNDYTHPDGGESDRYVCDACGKTTYPSDLVEHLTAGEKDALVSPGGALKAYAAPVRMFIVAEVDKKHNVATTVPEALRPLVGPTFALKQKLCRIQAMDAGHAGALVGQHFKDMPFREVEIGRDLEPTVIGWHGGRLSDVEKRRVEGQQVAARVNGLADLDSELEEIRRTRTAALRTA
jgi:hypothetical protein